MSDVTERYVDKFWELLDILLNAILFVLIGMEMLVLVFDTNYILAGVICIPVILLCRYVSLFFTGQALREEIGFCSQNHFDYDLGRFKRRYFDRIGFDAYSRYAAGYVFNSHLHRCGF